MDLSREDARSITFSQGDIQAIVPGEKGSRSKKEAIENVEQNLSNFDVRLEQFVKDLSFAHNQEFIDDWIEVCGDLHSVDIPDEELEWDIWSSDPVWNAETEEFANTDSRDFGMVLAQIARFFIEEGKYDSKRVAWGFLTGLVTQDVEMYEEEIEELEEIVEHLDEKSNFRGLSGINKVTNEGLHKGSIKAAEQLDYVTPTRTLVSRVSNYHQTLNEFEMENRVEWCQQVIKKLYRETDLHIVEMLGVDLSNDYDNLSDEGWNRIKPIDIIATIYNSSENRVRKATIAKNVDRRQSEVAKILNDLSGEGGITVGENWNDPSIVEEVGNGSGRYKLTDYGELLCYIFLEPGDGMDALHKYALKGHELDDSGHELISGVLDELDYRTNFDRWL